MIYNKEYLDSSDIKAPRRRGLLSDWKVKDAYSFIKFQTCTFYILANDHAKNEGEQLNSDS